jgi:lipopolysaccharide transport system ATP-binding protein
VVEPVVPISLQSQPQSSEIGAAAAGPDAEVRVSVRNVSKMYRLYNRPQDRLKEQLFGRFGRYYGREFWALRDVSFDVRQGEALGVIGRNGSGKSTLMQVIVGTLAPTMGEVQAHGRVTALLELGSGFNREFTGRENVYLNGAILGFSHKEMDELFDEIAAFAEIGEFMDQPVKTYSSGMYVRLAFAVQACVKPDILIVDEALSVGDIFFQQKCHARMEKMLTGNTTIVLVSHNMGAVQKYCARAILLEKGQPLFIGDATEAIKKYSLLQRSPKAAHLSVRSLPTDGFNETPFFDEFARGDLKSESQVSFWPSADAFIDYSSATPIGEGWARCTGIALCDANGVPCHVFHHGQRAYFYYEFEALQDLLVPCGVVTIANKKNLIVHGKASYQYQIKSFSRMPKGTRIRFRQSVVLNLRPSQYTFDVGLDMMKPEDYVNLESMSPQEIRAKVVKLLRLHQAGAFYVIPAIERRIAWNHLGICDLPGDCEIGLSRD